MTFKIIIFSKIYTKEALLAQIAGEEPSNVALT